MMEQSVLTQVDARGLATITLNRPSKHNAFDDEIIARLIEILDQLAANSSVRVVVLGANGKSFSAGADLNWMQRMANLNYDENLADAAQLALLLRKLNFLPKPTIARVQGSAFGGAVGLISCCDMAVAVDSAHFGLSEVKIGLAPATISPYVIAAMGARASRRYFLSAERFDAKTAKSLGLVNEVVTAQALDSVLEKMVDGILSNGPKAVETAKQLIFEVHGQAITDELIEHTSRLIATLRVSEEGQAGLKAFLNKQAPPWHIKGRAVE